MNAEDFVIASRSPLAVAVLLSGSGRTLENLLQKIDARELDARVVQVISSQHAVRGLEIARQAEIPTSVVRRREFTSPESHRDAIFAICQQAQSDLVVMAGYMQHVLIPPEFQYRVMNIHPALIPAFCGQGYYGDRVHRGVLEYGVKLTGCTVHFVDNQYDHGPIILQRTVPVADDDSVATLAARVFSQECEAYPEAIRRYASGNMRISGRKVWIAN